MKEATWGIFIIMIGLIGIIAFNLFRDLTATTDQTYYLMKEATRAAMGDAIDVSLQRTNSRIVMNEEKFVENLTRRFAQSVNINRDYYIFIHKIVEDPPMVSLSIVTNAEDLAGEKYDILLEVNAIFEVRNKLYTPEIPHYIEKPIIKDDDGEVICPDCEEYNFCIVGDYKFSGWELPEKPIGFPTSYKLFSELNNISKKAFYKECVDGKWEEKEESVNSVISNHNTYATYTWTFIKDGPVNDILQTLSFNVNRETVPLTLDCSPNNYTFYVGETKPISVNYSPVAPIQNFKWEKNNNNILLSPNPTITTPGTRTANVQALQEGSTTVTVTSVDYGSTTCNLNINITTPTCPALIILNESNPSNTINFPSGMVRRYVVSNSTYLNITTDGVISIKTNPAVVMNLSYTLELNSGTNLPCDVRLEPIPPEKVQIYCPNSGLSLNFNESKGATVVQGNQTSRPDAVSSWSLVGAMNASINSSSGVITSQSTTYNTKYYSANLRSGFIDGIDGDTTVTCPFSIGEDIPSTQGCPVGQVVNAVWTMPSLPDACLSAIKNQGQLFNASMPRATVNTRACGKEAVIYDNCRSVYYNDTFLLDASTVTVDEAAGKYYVKYPLSKDYSGWTDDIVTHKDYKGDPCLSKTQTYTLSQHPTISGRILPATECTGIDLLNNILAFFNIIKEKPFTMSPRNIAVDAGTTGVTFTPSYATIGGETITYTDPQVGRIQKINGGTQFKYIPPISGTDSFSVTFTLNRPGYDSENYSVIINVVQGKACESFSVRANPTSILYGGSSTISFNYDGFISNDNASWIVSHSSFQRDPAAGSTNTSVTITAPSDTGQPTTTVTVWGTRQISCPDTSVANTKSTSVKVCSKASATKYCDPPENQILNILFTGDKCYPINVTEPTCGTGETYLDGACYKVDDTQKTFSYKAKSGACTGNEPLHMYKWRAKTPSSSPTYSDSYYYTEAYALSLCKTEYKTCISMNMCSCSVSNYCRSVTCTTGEYKDGNCVVTSTNKPTCAFGAINSDYTECSAPAVFNSSPVLYKCQ